MIEQAAGLSLLCFFSYGLLRVPHELFRIYEDYLNKKEYYDEETDTYTRADYSTFWKIKDNALTKAYYGIIARSAIGFLVISFLSLLVALAISVLQFPLLGVTSLIWVLALFIALWNA